jgi:hypothetical protein
VIEEVNRTPAQERSVGELVSDLTDEVKRLVRDEMRLAAFELQRKGKRMGLGAGILGAAGLLALFGAATLVAAAVLALSLAVPGWLAAVIVGAVLLLAGGLSAVLGRKQVKQAVPPLPEEAINGVKEDIEVARHGAHR